MVVCKNCGNKCLDGAKFCSGCGAPFDLEHVNKSNEIKEAKMSGKAIVIVYFVVVLSIFLTFAFILNFIFGFMDEYEKAPSVIIGNDNIPTVKSVIGKKKICSVSINKNEHKYTSKYGYCDDSLDKNEYDKYLDYLISDQKYVEYNSTIGRIVAKESIDDGKIIIIQVDYDNDMIYYQKDIGTLEDNPSSPTDSWYNK